jgi:hypothetical protein
MHDRWDAIAAPSKKENRRFSTIDDFDKNSARPFRWRVNSRDKKNFYA